MHQCEKNIFVFIILAIFLANFGFNFFPLYLSPCTPADAAQPRPLLSSTAPVLYFGSINLLVPTSRHKRTSRLRASSSPLAAVWWVGNDGAGRLTRVPPPPRHTRLCDYMVVNREMGPKWIQSSDGELYII